MTTKLALDILIFELGQNLNRMTISPNWVNEITEIGYFYLVRRKLLDLVELVHVYCLLQGTSKLSQKATLSLFQGNFVKFDIRFLYSFYLKKVCGFTCSLKVRSLPMGAQVVAKVKKK